MESFFARVGKVWPAGRRDLHWHLLPSPEEAEKLLSAYPADRFSRPGLVRVPSEWLHCTLVHAVGMTAEHVDVDALIAGTQELARQTRPFRLTFDRPAVGPVAVEISGWPGEPFTSLVDGLTALLDEHHGGEFKLAASRYPHMSIAYTAAGAEAVDAGDLRQSLAHLDGPLSHTLHATRLHLVEQWHDGSTITWRTLASLPLDGNRRTTDVPGLHAGDVAQTIINVMGWQTATSSTWVSPEMERIEHRGDQRWIGVSSSLMHTGVSLSAGRIHDGQYASPEARSSGRLDGSDQAALALAVRRLWERLDGLEQTNEKSL
ncbi:2'-5' RNA ligase family protein [Streptomyces sp. NPDC046821]|uniref:2'-5' RNA ligase family protein n=1 Tax=Streptomyces sp. NPDC046821 TaxID=3154702 RepID=UPI0033CEF2EA